MNQLNKDEIKVLLEYVDHDTMRSLATVLIDQHPRQAFDVLNCAMDTLIEERYEIEEGIIQIARRLSDIELLSDKLSRLETDDEEEESTVSEE
jgi:hypothetical protein